MNLVDVLTTEIRKQSKKHYLFEEVSKDYKKKMTEIFQKAVKDELSAASIYYLVAAKITGFEEAEIAEELQKHAKEEYEHFTELIDYAYTHGIELEIGLNYTQDYPTKLEDVIKWKQDLETEAMNDYLNAAKLAEAEGDMLTVEFFRELAQDERKHLDDLLKYTDIGQEF